MAIRFLLGSLLFVAGCDRESDHHVTADDRPMNRPLQGVGAHALVFQRMEGGQSTLRTPPLTAVPPGSTVLVSVGRGQASAFESPTHGRDDRPLERIGSIGRYTHWPDSGTALYALEVPGDDKDLVIQARTPPEDEITLAAITVHGTEIEDTAWNEVLYPDNFWRLRRWLFSRNTVTSAPVETAGPATLVAFWWGDAAEEGEKTARPGDGFQLVDAVLEEGPLVQCAVAVRRVEKAGRYEVSWTASPLQGAQMWLVAIADPERG